MNPGQIIRITEGIALIFCGFGLAVRPAKLRWENRTAKVLLILFVAAAMMVEAASTFIVKYVGALYTILGGYFLVVLYAFFQISFWQLFAQNFIYWVNVKILHYFVIVLSCMQNNYIFSNYVEDALDETYTVFHIVCMLGMIVVACLIWYGKRERSFIVCRDKRGYILLAGIALAELLIERFVFDVRQTLVFISAEYVLFLCAMLLFILCTFAVFFISQQNLQMKHREQMLKMNYEMVEQQYSLLGKMYTEKRRQLHDIRQQHILLGEYLTHGNTEQAKSYLEEVTTKLNLSSRNRYSGIATIDFMLDYKEGEGRKKEIRFEIEVNVLFCPLKEDEMCILLGNLLDNAMEAAEKLPPQERSVFVKMRTENSMFFLEIRNAYIGKRRKQDGTYLTTKADKDMHGLGLESVKQIVEGNGGMLEIHDDGRVFEILVMLMAQKEISGPFEGQKTGE